MVSYHSKKAGPSDNALDIILKVAGILTVKGGTGAILNYLGKSTVSVLSCEGPPPMPLLLSGLVYALRRGRQVKRPPLECRFITLPTSETLTPSRVSLSR